MTAASTADAGGCSKRLVFTHQWLKSETIHSEKPRMREKLVCQLKVDSPAEASLAAAAAPF